MIIFIGIAGSGKSTQGQLIAKELGCDWVSTGKLFREALKDTNNPSLLDGELISDSETIDIVKKNIEKYGKETEFVLDGFPRTVGQAEWLVSQVEAGNYHLTLIVNLEASEEVVKDRLITRGRDDDKEEIIEKRFEVFERMTKPLIRIYKNSKLPLVDIDANRSAEEIHNDIIKYLV